MSNKSTFIKIDRNIQNWRWYQNANTFRVFIHCLLSANVSPREFEGITIKRGEFPTSYDKIANTLNLTNQQVRTALNHLKSTGEITTKIYPKFQVISIVNYGYYQDKSTGKATVGQQSINIQLTVDQQQYKNNNKNIKNDKNEREGAAHKNAYGSFKNVFLSDDEFEKLKTDYPMAYNSKIERLSEYMYQSGKTYQDHYLMIVKWAKEDERKSNGENNGSFDTDDFFNAAVKKSLGIDV